MRPRRPPSSGPRGSGSGCSGGHSALRTGGAASTSCQSSRSGSRPSHAARRPCASLLRINFPRPKRRGRLSPCLSPLSYLLGGAPPLRRPPDGVGQPGSFPDLFRVNPPAFEFLGDGPVFLLPSQGTASMPTAHLGYELDLDPELPRSFGLRRVRGDEREPPRLRQRDEKRVVDRER